VPRAPKLPKAPVKRARVPAKPARKRLGRATYPHGELRRARVDAAVTIIADHGAEAFTLREAARRLGVNHRAAYRHFADKTMLLAAVAEQGFAALVEGTRAEILAAGVTDPEGRLMAMARAYVAWADRHPAHFRVMFGPRLNEDGGAFEATMGEAYGLLESEIRAAIGAGSTLAGPGDDAVTDVVIAYWAVLHGLASLVLMKRVRVRRDQLPAWIDRIVGKAIRAMRR
jgi:AcrR family transcriptional regulator